MADITITRTDTDNRARYAAVVEGVAGEAEITLSKVWDTLIIAEGLSL